MKPRTLHLVPTEPTPDEIREQSAKAGVHLSDAMRAYIMSRDWGPTHIAGDRRAPVQLPDVPKRLWSR